MAEAPQNSSLPEDTEPRIGLTACGQAGEWNVSVDETISGTDQWFMQIEGPSTYLYFEIPSLLVVDQLLKVLDNSGATPAGGYANCNIGTLHGIPVTAVRDSEYRDRLFICIGQGTGCVQLTFVGDDFNALSAALARSTS